jgi:lipoprotein NlpD
VAKGDTAYSIARRHKVDWQELLRVNGMSDPRQLRAGQVLRIP